MFYFSFTFDFRGTLRDLPTIRERDRAYWQKHLDWEMVKRSEERGESLICQQADGAHFILFRAAERWWRGMPNDGGIDTVWDFSTISNNDLFSGAARCQVITFLRWKWTIFWHKQRCVSRQPKLATQSPHQGVSRDDPPSLQRPGSVCFHRPRDPAARPGQTTASFSAPLLTSLSLCEGKVQSCILLNGKWCVHR